MAHWSNIGYTEKEEHPINVEVEELQQNQDETDLLLGLSKIISPLEEKELIPAAVKVRAEQNEYAMRVNTRCRDWLISLA